MLLILDYSRPDPFVFSTLDHILLRIDIPISWTYLVTEALRDYMVEALSVLAENTLSIVRILSGLTKLPDMVFI